MTPATRRTGDTFALGSEVELTHVQLEQTFEGSVSLESEQAVFSTIYSGTGRAHEIEASPLSHIIERLNERFGLKLTEADRLHLDGIAQDLIEDETLQRQAAANSKANFEVQFPHHFQTAVVERLAGAGASSFQLPDEQGPLWAGV